MNLNIQFVRELVEWFDGAPLSFDEGNQPAFHPTSPPILPVAEKITVEVWPGFRSGLN